MAINPDGNARSAALVGRSTLESALIEDMGYTPAQAAAYANTPVSGAEIKGFVESQLMGPLNAWLATPKGQENIMYWEKAGSDAFNRG